MRISPVSAHMDEALKAWIGAMVCCILVVGLVLLALHALPVGVR
jgi:hypothetical protein